MDNPYKQMIEEALEAALSGTHPDDRPTVGKIPAMLNQAMRYSLLSGGKCIRSSMMLMVCDMLGGDKEKILPLACAVEMIHCYSLIHDDLPGMDDDVLRRGRPTNHVVFGVGQAILAGDGLLNLAYETMLQSALTAKEHPDRYLRAIFEIARGAGVKGMIAGQSLDLLLEHETGSSIMDLQFIQENKTAAMFVYPLRAAAQMCGADQDSLRALEAYGRAFGMLFQTVDDLLDVEGNPAMLGKSVGKDQQSGKLTAVSLYGRGGARGIAQQYLEEGLGALQLFGPEADPLRRLIQSMASREA